MTIYIGADHRGFALKEQIKASLAGSGYEIVDVGALSVDPVDDYPDFARAVAEKVAVAAGGAAAPGADTSVRGIVICGSGFGVDIATNKFKGVRSALAMSVDHIRAGRHDDDVNVLSIAADFTKPEEAVAITKAFLETAFDSGQERYIRRIAKIAKIEEE